MEDESVEYITQEMSQIPTNKIYSDPFRSVPLDLPMPAIIFDHIEIEPVNSIDDYIVPPAVHNETPISESPKIIVELLDKKELLNEMARSSKPNKNQLNKNPGKDLGRNTVSVLLTSNEKARKWKKKKLNINTFEGAFSVNTWAPGSDDETQSNRKINTTLRENVKKQQILTPLISGNDQIETTVSKIPIKRELSFRKPRQTNNNNKENNRIIPCSQENCGKMFCTQNALRKHTLTHGPKQYVCPQCCRGFVEKSKLKRHQLVHTGDKPFICNFEGCYKPFSLDFNLKTHFRIHTGDKPFVCPMDSCHKKYAKAADLKKHMFSHLKPNF